MELTPDRRPIRANPSSAHAWEQARRYAHELREEHVRLQDAAFQSLRVLANALDAKDPRTHGHSERVADWSARIASMLGLTPMEISTIRAAGLLHDIGKIGLPDAVLQSRERLDTAGLAAVRRHPEVGEQIVAPLGFFAEGALIIRHHHERLDGSGYPDGLAGKRIPLGARIVSVADVFDALSSDRSYRPAMSASAVAGILETESGVTLDPEVVDALFAAISAREAGL